MNAGLNPVERGVKLRRLAAAVPQISWSGLRPVWIRSLAYDSRQAQPGSLYVALPGARVHGNHFVEEAVRRGAAAVLGDADVRAPKGIPVGRVERPRLAMAELAAEFYGHPSRDLRVIGITGTNGKTTTSFLTRHLLRGAGMACGLIGTIHYAMGQRQLPATRTTPEAPDLQRMFAESLQGGDEALVMEVSSQGLAADRLHGVEFSAGVFTNLSEDHLDFHHTKQAYFAAKRELFELMAEHRAAAPAIINTDDDYGQALAAEPWLAGRVMRFGLSEAADVRARHVEQAPAGSRFEVVSPWGADWVELPLAGGFNVLNALASIATGGSLGISMDSMAASLRGMTAVPGRLERVLDARGKRHIFVDYAHTEDALRHVLQTLRASSPGRLVCVFGCGGDRDKGKRPRMGAVAAELADLAIVTSDNPRTEPPEDILADILKGMDGGGPPLVDVDRAKAIALGLSETGEGDVLVVAGKGHETYQEIGSRMIHFDDREVIRQLLG